MSYATLANVKNRVPVDITDAELQLLIDRIEARLIRHYGAPDATPRVDTFYDAFGVPITLSRTPTSVENVYSGTTVDTAEDDPLDAEDWRLRGNAIERLPYGYLWLDTTVIEWTPTDITDEWIEVVIDLVRLRLARTAHRAERFPEWSYSGADFEDQEHEIIRRLGGVVLA